MRRAILILLATACGSSAPRASAPPPAPPPGDAAPAPSPDAAPAAAIPLPPGVPDTETGHQLAWVLDRLAHGGVVDAAAVEAHFDPTFLDKVPVAQTIATFAALAKQLAPLTLDEVTEHDGRLIAKVTTNGESLLVIVHVAPSHKMDGLLVRPAIGPKPATFEEAVKAAGALASQAQLLVAAVDRGKCTPIHQHAMKDELAIGSTVKLYVLLAVVDRILAGKLHWDDEIAVRDDWKSLPSGITQDDPAGTKLTVRTLAERMISISDNTATDHLLYTVGRRAVEAAVRASGHAAPARDTPLLSTRELFLFKLGMSEDEIARYLALTPAKQRAFVDGLAGKRPTLDGVEAWTTARHIDRLEWFASAEDLCRVMATLQARAQRPAAAPLLDVLAKNHGMELDAATWPYAAFKGGSEPGVLNLTWLLRRRDDRWFVVVVGLNRDRMIEHGAAVGVAGGLVDLAAHHGT